MYDIRQFRPVLFTVVILGMVGFALSAEAPGMFVLASTLVAYNLWRVRAGRFHPLPRWLANAITLAALAFFGLQVGAPGGTPVLVIGRFLVVLQLVKLYERRSNRDDAQLLVLSLLLMVAAAISTASLLFGVLLIAYLVLSLYACLLFHLKSEADAASTAMSAANVRIAPSALRHDERRLGSSMRRLTALVMAFAGATALTVFVLFPRGAGANLFGPLQFRASQTLTGFSDQVSFQQVARITQNTSVVAHVKAWRDGKPLHGQVPLLLRGMTLDLYGGQGGVTGAGPWQWVRSPQLQRGIDIDDGATATISRQSAPADTRLSVTLQPTGTQALFVVGTPITLTPSHRTSLSYGLRDQTLSAREPLYSTMRYDVTCSTRMTGEAEPAGTPMPFDGAQEPSRTSPRSNIDPRIAAIARDPAVSGADAAGPLAPRRQPNGGPQAIDADIAANIERYLQTQFTYTLDLTDARKLGDTDPLVGFLTDFKRGHCEYFAGAMTVLCQSLGLDARMAIGFKCDEYSDVGDYYIVRQSHAHAWVEVNTPDGWRTYDPTSGREAPRTATLAQRLKHWLDYLQFQWASNVVAYDGDSRQNLITQVDVHLVNSAGAGSQWMTRLRRWLSINIYDLSSRVLSIVVVMMLAVLVGAVGWFVYERMKLRRRAERIGLDALPVSDRTRLARQLGFYDDLLRLLDRHHIRRPTHLTPMEFSDSLSFLPSETYHTIRRLTEMFYRVRFGGLSLRSDQQRRMGTVLTRLADEMSGSPDPRSAD